MIRRLARDESGIALVMALITMLVLASLTTAVSLEVTVNHRNAAGSANTAKAFAMAELGLSYAEGRVYSAAASHASPSTATTTFSQDGGTVSYYATVAADGVTWTMNGTGTVGGVSRSVSAQADVPSPVTVTDSGVWNYLFANTTVNCTNINGGTTVAVPTLIHGDLCISGGAHFTGTQLEVGGNLTVNGGANVGTSSTKLTKLNIVGASCTNGNTTVTPATGVCDGTHASIYSTSVTRTLSVSPSMPSVSLSTEYTNQAALTKTGCPANLLDSDATLNNSLSSATLTAAMFPSNSSYDCKVGTNEIKWNSAGSFCSNATLTVTGTLIFDGSLNLGCGFNIVYSGQASLYFTGTVSVAGGVKLCGIASCTASWNPDTNGIIIVAGCWANSTGSSLVNSQCVHYTGGATVQVGTYSTQDYTIDGGGTNMGPVLANTLTISGGSSSLIPFHTMPPGTPLNTSISYLPANKPTNWSG